ncbi:hypothetical protein MMIC_P1887 [Mariprofundus micogutta]|uniref:PQ loop repeat protein n=1 Tax=Mariprofundus micogutta TaxID=1921010 RepID=A0A1L8CPR7_9PROT|nr:hypothetical protein [Mariprofundus micogutta]GAV20911.1 hypothetical protein MMIC_P1887 [Mariprofundus micogutta]
MESIDGWQVIGSIAAAIFTLGFVDQLRVTLSTRNVDGLSIIQWCVFCLASAMFAAYYVHLGQWLMVSVSIFGTACCAIIVTLIFMFRNKSETG